MNSLEEAEATMRQQLAIRAILELVNREYPDVAVILVASHQKLRSTDLGLSQNITHRSLDVIADTLRRVSEAITNESYEPVYPA